MKRAFDLTISILLICIFFPIMVFIAIAIKLTSSGTILYWSDRVGRNNVIFKMPKFRTMLPDTPILATHLLYDSSRYLTPIGSFLRKSSLDELPQLWCVLIGRMSLVGPRPALYNQYDLISLRSNLKLDKLKPGLTGLAQVSGRDELKISMKVALDYEYLQKQSFFLDLKILVTTLFKVLRRVNISH